jgi:hypothetical protein
MRRSREGERLRVVFAKEGHSALLFKPVQGAWDWSGTSKLLLPIENPGEEAVTLLLGIESDLGGSLSGKVAIAPNSTSDLSLWLEAPSPRVRGMTAGPSLAAGGLEPGILPVTATEGSVDASHISSVRLGISRPDAPQHLAVGPLRVEPPSAADRDAYDGIVDGFGQMLRTRGAEEAQQLAQRLARSPNRDRFGGLDVGAGLRATGFFRTEKRGGRWWLVTPDGNRFFSIGMDVVAPSGATYVDGREFMFRDLPPRDGALAAHWSERDHRRGLGAQRGRG